MACGATKYHYGRNGMVDIAEGSILGTSNDKIRTVSGENARKSVSDPKMAGTQIANARI
jgi:hypothetical protein